MTREKALHEWKREVETWNKCSNLYPECKILYGEFAYFINILDAIIDPKDEYTKSEEAWKQEFEKNQATTCKVCLKKAYDNHEIAWPTKCTCDDGWKPWPPSKSLQYDPLSYANIVMKTDDEGSIRWWKKC